MGKQIIKLEARREAYGIKEIYDTMTVGELKSYLEQFEDDVPVYLSHDNGYTYGGIRESDFTDEWIEDENEEEEES